MRVRFWGTRGSIAKAGPGTVRFGGNTSCVEVRSSQGTLLVVDCGTGAHGLGQSLIAEAGGAPVNGHMLIGHTHWDHIQGLPFFAPLRCHGNAWHIYGPRGMGPSLREAMAGQMQYTYFPVTLDQIEASVEFHDLAEGDLVIDDVAITAQYLNHTALTLGYRIVTDGATVVYASDHEPHAHELAGGGAVDKCREDARHVAFLAGADLVIHDTQYLAEEYPKKIGWGHSTVEYAVDCALAAGARRLALYHHDPTREDAAVASLEARAQARVRAAGGSLVVFAAREGLALDLEGAEGPATGGPLWRPGALEPPALSTVSREVLLAARDADVCHRVREAAAADGLKVLDAADVDEVVETVRNARPAVVLVEPSLPGGGVVEVSSRVRALPRGAGGGVPIIGVVARDRNASRAEAETAGVTDWLQWPFDSTYARTRLRAWRFRQAPRWKRAPLAASEPERLAALRRLRVLDTPAEDRFDRYTRIAAQMFDVPIALVSLVDADRQWFKSRYGLETRETPRDMAFCAHAILQDDVLQVSDALDDDRFADNPLVTGDSRMRFYAGVPLTVSGGQRVGTLCVIDHRPRRLDESQLRILRDLGELVETELERSNREAR